MEDFELNNFDTKIIYTVSKITRELKNIIENNYFNIILVGEISNYKKASSGHIYLSLKDENAVINGVIFKNIASSVKFELENGLEVKVQGRISVYENRGSYQIIINNIEPIGKGALQLAFEQLFIKLKNKGYFDKEKKVIPEYPQKIGVVTSPTGAAIRDIINVIKRRFRAVEIYLFPTKVQGEGSALEISKAIDFANELNNIDILIVGRGGGSIEDLWSFNEEIVVESIFRSKIPIVSAVGHEIDYTISDYVADLRAPTPSSAGELVTKDASEILNMVDNYVLTLKNILKSYINIYKEKVSNILENDLPRAIDNYIYDKKMLIDELFNKLNIKFEDKFSKYKNNLNLLVEKLNILNPISSLKRGFSITYKIDKEKRKLIESIEQIQKDDEIEIKLSDGIIIAKVNNFIENN